MIRWAWRLLRRRDVEADITAEWAFHQQARAADLMAEGLSPAEATRQARLEFGSATAYREEARQVLGFRCVDELRADLRFAFRSLSRSPAFTLAALGILAIAIGANATFFTLYSHYVLKPLPIRGAERHVDLVALDRHSAPLWGWAADEIDVLRDSTRAEMEGVYTCSGLLQVLLLEPQQRHSMVMGVSEQFFPLLGGTARLGRVFTADDQRQAVAVLSHAGSRRLFPDDPSPIGKTLRVRSTWFTVVGVVEPTFTGIEAAVPDFWIHASMRGALRDGLGDRHAVSGVLRPGVSAERAEAVLSAVGPRLPRRADEAIARVDVRAHATYLSVDAPEARLLAPLLFATFLTVLLIASANLANLFLARMAARRPEIAIRFSVGAGRGRIVRQLLTESMLLGLAGAAVGLLLATIGVSRVQAWLFSIATNAGATVLPLTMDWRLFAYAAALGLLAGALFGMLPALDAVDLVRKRRRRLRSVLLAGQVGASLVLLVLAGLLVRNLQRLEAVTPGYDLDHTFGLQIDPPTPAVVAHLRTLPGVAGISVVSRLPLLGRLRRDDAQVGSAITTVTPMLVDDHYFATMGLSITRGRGFTGAEAANRARVAIVSESGARRLWPHDTAIGQAFTVLPDPEDDSVPQGSYEVIGVAPDVINGFIFEGPEPAMIYLPGAVGQPDMRASLIRVTDNRPAMLATIREACSAVPGSTGCAPRSLDDVAATQRFPFQAAAVIAGALGLLALLLTAIGLYSVVSYSVEQRRREIGVLVAIGALPRHVMRRILDEPARCLAWGIGVGLPCCFVLSWLAASSPLGVQTFDAGAYAGVSAMLVAIAAAACLVPVRRALRVQPSVVLRQD